MVRKLFWFVMLLALILSACGGQSKPDLITAEIMMQSDYEPAKDPIVDAYDVGDTQGEYAVYRQQGNYFTKGDGDDLPDAVYVTYFWLTANEMTSACPETYVGIPLFSCDVMRLGFTDKAPADIMYSGTIYYGADLESADVYMQTTGSLPLNTMPPECVQVLNTKPIMDYSVKIVVPRP